MLSVRNVNLSCSFNFFIWSPLNVRIFHSFPFNLCFSITIHIHRPVFGHLHFVSFYIDACNTPPKQVGQGRVYLCYITFSQSALEKWGHSLLEVPSTWSPCLFWIAVSQKKAIAVAVFRNCLNTFSHKSLSKWNTKRKTTFSLVPRQTLRTAVVYVAILWYIQFKTLAVLYCNTTLWMYPINTALTPSSYQNTVVQFGSIGLNSQPSFPESDLQT